MPALLRVLVIGLCGFFVATEPISAQSAEDLRIPVRGTGQSLVGRLCRPVSMNPAPLVVIAHGSPANGSERPGITLKSCGVEAAQWFLMRGYAVVFALRRGYGATGGPWAEDYGSCARPDYVRAGLETARADSDSSRTRIPR